MRSEGKEGAKRGNEYRGSSDSEEDNEDDSDDDDSFEGDDYDDGRGSGRGSVDSCDGESSYDRDEGCRQKLLRRTANKRKQNETTLSRQVTTHLLFS
jgi:hypothetical protein